MLNIREEQPQDILEIRQVLLSAFAQPEEAEIVDQLRENCTDLLSLVAVHHGQIVGHILFSPAVIQTEQRAIQGMGLAPMAVLPEYQQRGVGSELVRNGIAKLAIRHCPFIIVLGHPEYYPRFGFEAASKLGVQSEWDVPDEAFMILVLDKSEMQGVQGVAKYRDEFAGAV